MKVENKIMGVMKSILIFLLLGLSTSSFANLVINTSDYQNSDINVIPILPIQGKEARIQTAIFNQSNNSVEATVYLQIDNKPVPSATQTLSFAGNEKKEIEWKWTPQENGWREILVTVVEKKTGKKSSGLFRTPVIVKPLYFSWFENDKSLRYANLVMVRNKADHDYWQSRGVIPWMWKGAKTGNTPEEYANYLYKNLDTFGAKAIHIDEIGGYLDSDIAKRPQIEGIRLFKKNHPDIFLGLYVCGSLKPVVAHLGSYGKNQAVDLLLLESYLNYKVPIFNSYTRYTYFDQRILMARDYDALESSLMILGTKGMEDSYDITTSDLEEQVRYIRMHAPEMPGIGFFTATPRIEGIREFADSLCRKYYIQPVITLWDRDVFPLESNLIKGKPVTLQTVIHNIGGMDAKNVRVSFYQGNPLYGGKRIGSSLLLSTVPAGKTIPPGKTIVTQKWTPPKAGYYEIFVEITPENGETTVLQGFIYRVLFIQEK
ncbi:MAG: hypothetical protein WDA18_02625 [Candidatus Ratteibacteria bacterium]